MINSGTAETIENVKYLFKDNQELVMLVDSILETYIYKASENDPYYMAVMAEEQANNAAQQTPHGGAF